jgi:FAD/FMN-containing dehydrogenase
LADVIAAVRLARDEALGVRVMATGHGFVSPCYGGVLINTSRMKGVRVDPGAQTAGVEPGALWTDVIPEAQVFGLAGLVGSSSIVGVVGYTIGGGFGWLGSKYGFNATTAVAFMNFPPLPAVQELLRGKTGLGSARSPRWRNVFRCTWLT